jgi:DNA-directed RNA polymerase specialized sigma subunit
MNTNSATLKKVAELEARKTKHLIRSKQFIEKLDAEIDRLSSTSYTIQNRTTLEERRVRLKAVMEMRNNGLSFKEIGGILKICQARAGQLYRKALFVNQRNPL